MTNIIKLPMQDYHSHPAISKSGLDLIHRSPAHYMENKLNPPEQTESMRWGSMLHAYVLDPDVFDAQYAVVPNKIDKRTSHGKAEWSEWLSAHLDKIPVDKPTMNELDLMRDAIFAHSKAKNALVDGVAETCLFWIDEEKGCECKARPDYITPSGLIVDLKTCVDARPREFAKACANFRYHVQAAYYTEGYYRVYGEYPVNFMFIAIEKTPPYAVALYTAQEMLNQGYMEFNEDLQVYAECLRTGTWPAYTEDVTSLILPKWAQEVA